MKAIGVINFTDKFVLCFTLINTLLIVFSCFKWYIIVYKIKAIKLTFCVVVYKIRCQSLEVFSCL